ncbi:MAG: ATP-binding protein, partial [Chloroflexota bacterium]|nr:ATP-binding protein [Chloroflexota bacterium]
PREVFLYQMTDASRTWGDLGLQAVAWQTGFNPVIAMQLLANGAWSGSGVLTPEALDPDPYLALLDAHGIHHAMVEMEPGAHRPT